MTRMSANLARQMQGAGGSHHNGGQRVARGDDAIFGTGPYPRTLEAYVGQNVAKAQIASALASCRTRGVPFHHTLLSHGLPGLGKTSLAKIIASSLGTGYIEIGGTVTAKDAAPILRSMETGDVLFIDEIHRMVSSGKRNAEWLLQLLQDGVLALPTGTLRIAPITVIAATTDRQKLPRTIIDRFTLQPLLEPYTEAEAIEIVRRTAVRMSVGVTELELGQIAIAADCNPRMISTILTTVRDLHTSKPSDDAVSTAISWCGVSHDGISRSAQDYLMILLGYGGVAAVGTMRAVLNEISIEQTEQSLIQKGMIAVTPRGRELTPLGAERAELLIAEQEDAQ